MLAGALELVRCVDVIDDDESFRRSVLRLLGSHGYQARGYGCAGEFLLSDGMERAGCVLLDINMPDLNGMRLLRALRERSLAPPVVMLTALDDVTTCVDAIKIGAIDYLVKPINADKLLDCVARALRIDDDAKVAQLKRDALRARLEQLSAVERRILLGLASHRLNKQLAVELGACERTIKAQRARVRTKLELRSLPDLVRAAIELERMLTQKDRTQLGLRPSLSTQGN